MSEDLANFFSLIGKAKQENEKNSDLLLVILTLIQSSKKQKNQ